MTCGWVTPVFWVALAMMAEAGDEATMFLRIFDDENADSSEIAFATALFLQRIQWLFIDANV